MSLCFLQAFEAKQNGRIAEREYLHHLFGHCRGVEHKEDKAPAMGWLLRGIDPFGYLIHCWSKKTDPIKDATPFENVFEAYRMGNIDDIKAKLDVLGEEQAKFVRKLLALLSLQEGCSEVLKLCLDLGGFAFEKCFEDEASRVSEDNDPKTFKVLEESEFRKTYPRRTPITENSNDEGEDDGYEDPSADFDEGGSHPVDW
ncbi:hypothetical protein AOQ84DRAFT_386280 [Glonium stellatum]|uniref:Uncharacterized protein n=1 Tax=Glonium stellatum TaxID=574774 RepID=A0A8E2F8F3_9PEZI|nr:hypothetical protein AOQ84DRAFT_386280 [Glonium stellatum]